MKNSILILLFSALLLAACSNTKETRSGLKYTVLRKGSGEKTKSGQILVITLTFKDNKDSVWTDTRKNDFPYMIMVMDSVPKGNMVMEVFQDLTKGDSVTFQVKAKDLFEKSFQSPVPPMVDSTGMFTFNIGTNDVITEEEAKKMQSDYIAKQTEKAELEKKEQLAKDTLAIDLFLKEKGIVAKKTTSGLRYVITKPGKGENAKAGQSVKVNYAGFLLDGTFFDSSNEAIARANNAYNQQRAPYEPLQLMLGYQQVIAGWEEALMLMNKGAKMTVYIPSTLAYGPQRRSEVIAENSILTFDLELLEIK